MTACAATQSQMFRVWAISQVTRLNQTNAASSSPGCISIGTAVPAIAATACQLAEGDLPPVLADDVPHEEPAQEELFDDRHDECQADEADRQKRVGPRWRGGQLFERIERWAFAEAEETCQAKRFEDFLFQPQLAECYPKDDPNGANKDC